MSNNCTAEAIADPAIPTLARKRNLRRITQTVAVSLASMLWGCGGSDDPAPTGPDKVVATITIVDGNNQSGTVGQELATALTVTLTNKSGQTIADQAVNFVILTGGGSMFATTAVSDANGVAKGRWTLGIAAGAQTAEVRAASGGSTVAAAFTATATAAAANSVSVSLGNSQSATQLQMLPNPVAAIVKDAFGNPVPNVSVSFTANQGGSAAPATVLTTAAGIATTAWTLGLAIGAQTLNATVAGLSPAQFTATATQAPPGAATTLTLVSPAVQTVAQHVGLPVRVLVTDALNNPVPNQLVTFTAVPGNGYSGPVTVMTDDTGYAAWTAYFHMVGSKRVDVSTAGVGTISANATVTASTHDYDGLYLCQLAGTGGGDFPMTILDGQIVDDPSYRVDNGLLNETNGTFTVSAISAGDPKLLSATITIDGTQHATATGTWIAMFTNGTGSCDRL